jgi:hypothetical protein
VPAGAEPTEVHVKSGTIPARDFTSFDYEVNGRREPSGALSVQWAAPSSLGGVRQTLVAPDGSMPVIVMPAHDLGVPDKGQSAPPPTSNLTLPMCGAMVYTGRYREVVTGQSCSESWIQYRVSLVTPWSNVVEVSETRRTPVDAGNYYYTPARDQHGDGFSAIAWASIGFSWLVAGDIVLGVLLSAKPPVKAAVVGGSVAATIGLTIPLVRWVYDAFDKTTVLYPWSR